MRQAVTFVQSLAVLLLASTIGLAKDPPKDNDPDKPEKTDKKKSSFERVSGRTLEEWIRLLKSTDPSIRFDAIHAIQFYGADSRDAVVPVLHILSNDNEATLRSNAAVVLMNIEIPDSKVADVVDALYKQLEINQQVNVRFHCAVTLGRFEELAKKAVPTLVKYTADPRSWEIRQAACYSLARVYANPKKLAPDVLAYTTLLHALRDSASKVRHEALQGLLMFGTPPSSEKKLIQEMNQGLLRLTSVEREHSIVVWAYFGLMLNDGVKDDYLNAMVRLMQTGDVPTRIQSLRALGMLIKEARTDGTKKKMPEILAVLNDSESSVVAAACDTLASISEKRELSDDILGKIKAVADDPKREPDLRFYVRQVHANLTKKPDKTKKPETVVLPDK
jgi:HEAT repeat protein